MTDKPKRKVATICFSDKAVKEEIQNILREPRIQNLMPAEIRGKDGKMVHWAVRHLKFLADKGKMRVEVPMFEEENSAQLRQLLDENAMLKQQLAFLNNKIASTEI